MSKTHEQMYLTDKRYLAALQRFREKVVSDPSPKATGFDCTERGAKDTQCNWGLCSEAAGDWPREDLMFPELKGRLDSKYLESHQLCPYDTRQATADDFSLLNGCFHTCMFFKRQSGKRPSKEQVIRLYDERIAHAKKRIEAKGAV